MRNTRVYTQHVLEGAEHVVLDGPVAHHLSRVLRMSIGAGLILFDGGGRDYHGEICEIGRQTVTVRLKSSAPVHNESPLRITLVQAISRGERMDYTLQKATELGVYAIQPVTSQRVGVKLDKNRLIKRLAHWRSVVHSACEQSGRARIPAVQAPMSLDEWLSTPPEHSRLVLDPLAQSGLAAYEVTGDSLSVLVGPEGGFTETEMGALKKRAVTPVSLGQRVLRTETAGPAAITVLQVTAGDFRP